MQAEAHHRSIMSTNHVRTRCSLLNAPHTDCLILRPGEYQLLHTARQHIILVSQMEIEWSVKKSKPIPLHVKTVSGTIYTTSWVTYWCLFTQIAYRMSTKTITSTINNAIIWKCTINKIKHPCVKTNTSTQKNILWRNVSGTSHELTKQGMRSLSVYKHNI